MVDRWCGVRPLWTAVEEEERWAEVAAWRRQHRGEIGLCMCMYVAGRALITAGMRNGKEGDALRPEGNKEASVFIGPLVLPLLGVKLIIWRLHLTVSATANNSPHRSHPQRRLLSSYFLRASSLVLH